MGQIDAFIDGWEWNTEARAAYEEVVEAVAQWTDARQRVVNSRSRLREGGPMKILFATTAGAGCSSRVDAFATSRITDAFRLRTGLVHRTYPEYWAATV